MSVTGPLDLFLFCFLLLRFAFDGIGNIGYVLILID